MSENKQVKEYIGKFDRFYTWGLRSEFKDLVIRDITDLEGHYISGTGKYTFVDAKEVEPELITNLETNDLLQFEGDCSKNDKGKVFIDHITNIKNITQ